MVDVQGESLLQKQWVRLEVKGLHLIITIFRFDMNSKTLISQHNL